MISHHISELYCAWMTYFVASLLQSTHMASPHITEEAVYLCTGNPLPKDIEQISYWLLNEQFADSFKSTYRSLTSFNNVMCN